LIEIKANYPDCRFSCGLVREEQMMIGNGKHRTLGISRRSLFRGAAIAACSFLAVLGMESSAIAKMSQKAAGYQEKPKDNQQCSNCALFKAPDACTLVDGSINPDGWCRFYSKKS
jgi:hypothetical protein